MEADRFDLDSESLRELGSELLREVVGGSDEFPDTGGEEETRWGGGAWPCNGASRATCFPSATCGNTCATCPGLASCVGNTCDTALTCIPSNCGTFFGC